MMVSANGADLFMTSRGAGPPCVVLCNLGTRVYEQQMPAALDAHLQLVFLDLRGSGRSSGEAADLTFDVLADDLEAVRAQLGVARLAVLGHSILGMLAIEHARRRPAQVSFIITVGTPPFGDMGRLVGAGTAHFDSHASEERKALLRANMAGLPPGTPRSQAVFAQTPMRFFDPRFDARPLFADADIRPKMLMHLLGTLGLSWKIEADPRALSVPWLLVLGRYDYIVPLSLWDEHLPGLRSARREIFERSGHQPFVEEPDRFAAVVGDWVAGIDARARE